MKKDMIISIATASDDRPELIADVRSQRNAEKRRLMGQKVLTWEKSVIRKVENLTMRKVIRFQKGNKKLASGNGIAFIIFSLPAVLTCPGATVHCMQKCYARRDERYPSVRASRIINFELSQRSDFSDNLYDSLMNAIYTKKGNLRRRFINNEIIVRVHESGDFYSVEYMKAWFKVARRFYTDNPTLNIRFFAYTKSFEMYEECMKAHETAPNFEVRGSVWDDTTAEEIETIKRCGMTIYTALDDDEFEMAMNNGATACTCDSCTACGCACARHEETARVVRIH